TGDGACHRNAATTAMIPVSASADASASGTQVRDRFGARSMIEVVGLPSPAGRATGGTPPFTTVSPAGRCAAGIAGGASVIGTLLRAVERRLRNSLGYSDEAVIAS